jgi:heptose I phosphotransferase
VIELEAEFAAQLPSGVDAFDYIMQLDGEMFRDIENRRTLRFSLNGRRYFLKAHYGVGWKEIIKNLLQFRLPVLGARNEWCAIKHLQQLDVDTMILVGYGERGLNPARRQSFVVTEALEETISLEDFCADWEEAPPATKAELRFKRALINKLAEVSRRMHESGMNHRDYYLCHFLLDRSAEAMKDSVSMPRLSLIDLHRVQIRKRTPLRWIVKDIGGLYFSSMRIGLTRRDLYRFMMAYKNKCLRDTLQDDGKFWSRCRLRACGLYHSFYHKLPPAS